MTRRAETKIDRTADIALVCSLDWEAGPFVRRLQGRRRTTGARFQVVEGKMAGRPLAVVEIGSTGTRLEAATEALLLVHRPRWLIAAGFAVGLSEEIQRGQIMIATEVKDEAGTRVPVDPSWAGNLAGEMGIRLGRIVTVRRLPRTAASKYELGKASEATAADRQSFTISRVCAGCGVNFGAVRVITEDARQDSEPGAMTVYHPSSSFRAGGMVGAFMSGAGRASRLWKLRDEAKKHAEHLANVLSQIVSRLP